MTDFDSDEALILARARRAFEPNAGAADRVLRATSLALGLPVIANDSAGAASGHAGESAGTVHAGSTATQSAGGHLTAGAGAKLSPLMAAASKWIAGALVVSAAAGGGYVLGFRAGREESRAAATQPIATPSPATAVMATQLGAMPSLTPVATATQLGATPSPAPGLTPVAASTQRATALPAPQAAIEPVAGPQPSPPDTHAPALDDPQPTTAIERGARTSAAPTTPSIQIELRALRRVERALRDGHPGIAIRTLSQLDRDAPRGQMLEERAAAWALARCAKTPSRATADSFAKRHPASVYADRVVTACQSAAAVSGNNLKAE